MDPDPNPDPNLDPEFPEKSDPDPKKIISDPQHCPELKLLDPDPGFESGFGKQKRMIFKNCLFQTVNTVPGTYRTHLYFFHLN